MLAMRWVPVHPLISRHGKRGCQLPVDKLCETEGVVNNTVLTDDADRRKYLCTFEQSEFDSPLILR